MQTIETTTLSNGVRVVTDRMRDVATAHVAILIGAGSRHETSDKAGLAHFVEHAVFKGTKRRPSPMDISGPIEARGGYINAWTDCGETAYTVSVLGEDVAEAVDLLADMVTGPLFDEEAVERERSVILEEIVQYEDDPDQRIDVLRRQARYGLGSLGRPRIGYGETVKGITSSDLAGFVQRHYVGHSMILTAAGRVDHAEVVEHAQRCLGGVAAGVPFGPDPAFWVGDAIGEDRDDEQVRVSLDFHGVDRNHEDLYPQRILTWMLAGGMSCRLFQELREKRGLVYDVGGYDELLSDTGHAAFGFASSPANAVEALKVLCAELSAVGAGDLKEETLSAAKMQFRASALIELESSASRAMSAGLRMLHHGKSRTVSDHIAAMQAVDLAAVKRVASKMLTREPAISALGPLKQASLPDASTIRSWLR